MGFEALDPLGVVSFIYQIIQIAIAFVFAPLTPASHFKQTPLGHVAVIGAGVTGVSTAAHLIGHGFEVTIFEAGSEERLGGIWSRVNSTSGLQISSILYRWHPAVLWSKGYPKRDEILKNVKMIWKKYDLQKRTRFNTKIDSVTRHSSSTDPKEGGHARWIINGEQNVVYDGLVVSTGTCGEPKKMDLPNQDRFKGVITHSSQLDNVDLVGKRVAIIGGGASGIEALELAVEKKAKSATILARSDKWMIPRNTLVDTLLALQPLGRETYLSFIPEFLLRKLHYRDLEEKMAPTQGFYQDTPIVNSSALQHIRQGKADYIRGDVRDINEHSVSFNVRKRSQKKGTNGKHITVDADVIVIATGFEVPKIDFLPQDLFPEDYTRPNLYLQVFPITDVSVVTTNASFVKAVGTVAHVHIGIYARILAVFLMEADTRPHPRDARLWVDGIRWFKENAPGGKLSFFTYMELMIWLVSFLFFRLNRLKYAFFVLFGWGYWQRSGPIDKQGRATGKATFHWSLTKLLPWNIGKSEKRLGGPLPPVLHAKGNGRAV
ncbi:hypothetical protein L7F22_019745 [Adiantum nelumboides]|nr:hypothetical protein [Adiantum nelumboides]